MDRGDLYHVDLNPTQGREQAGKRYVMIVSPRAFNRLGTPLVCPITQGGDFARSKGFAVSLSGGGTNAQGVVLCNQPRVLDLQNRGATFAEKAPTGHHRRSDCQVAYPPGVTYPFNLAPSPSSKLLSVRL